MKVRLLITEVCNRNCAGCCNNQYDLSILPKLDASELSEYELIMLTGGEPMLYPNLIRATALHLKLNGAWCPLYLYTAKVDDIPQALSILQLLDGMTLTLHTTSDVKPFLAFNEELEKMWWSPDKALRLNIFKEVEFPKYTVLPLWGEIRYQMEWIENCPLPQDEIFRRI